MKPDMELKSATRQELEDWMELVAKVKLMDPEREITVTTYREGDPAGDAARAFYKRPGFTEGKLTEEFGSLVQELIWKPGERLEE